MKRLNIILILILMFGFAKAQDDSIHNVQSVKVSYRIISYAYEKTISKKSTINFEFSLTGVFGSDYYLLKPVIRVEPRYYYNYLKRKDKGRNVANNSASYLSLSLDYDSRTIFSKNAYSIPFFSAIPKWGLKRTICSHFIFEFATGIGAFISKTENWKPTFGMDLKFGYVI